jgi:hypothetical protein
MNNRAEGKKLHSKSVLLSEIGNLELSPRGSFISHVDKSFNVLSLLANTFFRSNIFHEASALMIYSLLLLTLIRRFAILELPNLKSGLIVETLIFPSVPLNYSLNMFYINEIS